MERMRELEAGKTSLEGQLASLQEDLEGMVKASLLQVSTSFPVQLRTSVPMQIDTSFPTQAHHIAGQPPPTRRSLAGVLTDVQQAQAALKAELDADRASAQAAAAILDGAAEAAASLDLWTVDAGAGAARQLSALEAAAVSQARLEFRAWAAEARCEGLRRALSESGRTAGDAVNECYALLTQVRPAVADPVVRTS
jgi:hypothetical protein